MAYEQVFGCHSTPSDPRPSTRDIMVKESRVAIVLDLSIYGFDERTVGTQLPTQLSARDERSSRQDHAENYYPRTTPQSRDSRLILKLKMVNLSVKYA